MGDKGLPLALLFALSSIAMALLSAGTVSCIPAVMTTSVDACVASFGYMSVGVTLSMNTTVRV